MKIYLVGGAVRDELLGIKSNDLDYVVVLEKEKITGEMSPFMGYIAMKVWLEKEGFQIFLETPEMYTIRAKFPKGHKNEGIVGDFVLARKEIGYEPYSRRPIISLGTLMDDLERRDFTVNAMAKDEEGNIFDPFEGSIDLASKFLKTPLPANITFNDDPLRMIRALRFSLTKGLTMSFEIKKAMGNPDSLKKLKEVVSQERIREELMKMFKHDTKKTIEMIVDADKHYFFGLLDVCFSNGLWLKPTNEKI